MTYKEFLVGCWKEEPRLNDVYYRHTRYELMMLDILPGTYMNSGDTYSYMESKIINRVWDDILVKSIGKAKSYRYRLEMR